MHVVQASPLVLCRDFFSFDNLTRVRDLLQLLRTLSSHGDAVA